MKHINEVKINFPAKSANEAFARSAVAAFVMQLDPTISELADIKTSVSEAVTNSIVHGYKGGKGVIYINVRITDSNVVIIKIRDKGCGIEDIEKAMEPLFTTGGDERAGLGFAVMQSFMDSIKVSSKLNKGTTVTLKKKIIKNDP
ncbi:MAG: anti-sigma F factor [Clostridia bacterium]|nr:anti-sigma F factor [Clostridia bacterium]